MQLDANTAQSAINVVFGVLTVAAAMVRLLGRENTWWGRFILKIGNDFLPHKPPPDPGAISAPPKSEPKQPSSGLMFVASTLAFTLAFLFAGCAATNTAAKDPLKAADDLFAMVCDTDTPIATCVHGFQQVAKRWTDRMAAKMAPIDAGVADSASK